MLDFRAIRRAGGIWVRSDKNVGYLGEEVGFIVGMRGVILAIDDMEEHGFLIKGCGVGRGGGPGFRDGDGLGREREASSVGMVGYRAGELGHMVLNGLEMGG